MISAARLRPSVSFIFACKIGTVAAEAIANTVNQPSFDFCAYV